MTRTKGALNLATQESIHFRVKFREFCYYAGGFDRFMVELMTLHGQKYVESFLHALEFIEPKLARNIHTDADGKPLILINQPYGYSADNTISPRDKRIEDTIIVEREPTKGLNINGTSHVESTSDPT